MPSNAEAKRKGKSKGRQVEEGEVTALERLPAEEELEGSKAKCGFCHRPRLPPPLEGGKLYTLKARVSPLTTSACCSSTTLTGWGETPRDCLGSTGGR